ncbi:MAG: ATP-binding cassette domain-containing protein [Lachnospiraceae bacterium]|nr:ATP-binding cassette domain-containing protein [Lachnospiraceae bacterium]
MIKIRDLEFEYYERDDEENLTDMVNAIRGINFDANKGDFIAVAGRNGSGKSTFAKILNRLLIPLEGTVIIDGIDAINDDDDKAIEIRRKIGMVFQNPDDQIIGSIVSEDVAFGAENISVPHDELWERVYEALEKAGLGMHMADKKINELSGGEKQKVAVAGVLAMKPECIVLDEATSMLDPVSRWELLGTIRELNEKFNITIIMITHNMDELLLADYIYIMNMGKLYMRGRREVVFDKKDKLKKVGLECPLIIDIRDALYEQGVIRDKNVFSVSELVGKVKSLYPDKFTPDTRLMKNRKEAEKLNPTDAILINHLNFSYGKKNVLNDVSFSIGSGECVAIVGNTGVGKSTLIKLIPGLLTSDEGTVYIDGIDVMDRASDLRKIRSKIGLVFQYPEQQLFAKNVYEDVVFGPRNMGISEVEAEKRAYEAINLMGLTDDVYDMSLSKLSGGQKRRVAMAGVLAMKPKYLILDEPLAGLDPEGRHKMLEIIKSLHEEAGITIVMVSHDIESVAEYADRVIALDEGHVVCSGKPAYVFYEMFLRQYEILKKKDVSDKKIRLQLENSEYMHNLPVIMQLLIVLRLNGLNVDCLTVDNNQGIFNIIKALGLDVRG